MKKGIDKIACQVDDIEIKIFSRSDKNKDNVVSESKGETD